MTKVLASQRNKDTVADSDGRGAGNDGKPAKPGPVPPCAVAISTKMGWTLRYLLKPETALLENAAHQQFTTLKYEEQGEAQTVAVMKVIEAENRVREAQQTGKDSTEAERDLAIVEEEIARAATPPYKFEAIMAEQMRKAGSDTEARVQRAVDAIAEVITEEISARRELLETLRRCQEQFWDTPYENFEFH